MPHQCAWGDSPKRVARKGRPLALGETAPTRGKKRKAWSVSVIFSAAGEQVLDSGLQTMHIRTPWRQDGNLHLPAVLQGHLIGQAVAAEAVGRIAMAWHPIEMHTGSQICNEPLGVDVSQLSDNPRAHTQLTELIRDLPRTSD